MHGQQNLKLRCIYIYIYIYIYFLHTGTQNTDICEYCCSHCDEWEYYSLMRCDVLQPGIYGLAVFYLKDISPIFLQNVDRFCPSFEAFNPRRQPSKQKFFKLWEISGFRRKVYKDWALPGNYAACAGNSLPTFRDNLWSPIFKKQKSTLTMGPIGCSETMARNYHYMLRNSTEERSSLLQIISIQTYIQITYTSNKINNYKRHLENLNAYGDLYLLQFVVSHIEPNLLTVWVLLGPA